jgi:hypothetical protein
MIKVPILKSGELTSNGNQYNQLAIQNWFNNIPYKSSIPINIRKPGGDVATVGYIRKDNIKIEGNMVYIVFGETYPVDIIGRYLVPSVRVESVNTRSMIDKNAKFKDREKTVYSEIIDFDVNALEASLKPPAFPSFQSARVVVENETLSKDGSPKLSSNQ